MGGRDPRGADRGQAFTVEAVLALLVLAGTLVFVVGVGGVTPLSAGTAGAGTGDQYRGVAAGALDEAVRDDELRPTLLYWNESNGSFHGVGETGAYVAGGPPTAFGALLNRTFASRSAAFNVDLVFLNASGQPVRVPLVHQGTPSDDASRVQRSVTLYDGDRLRAADGTPTNVTVASSTTYVVPDADPDGPLYNVVRVEVVAWPA